MAHHQKPMKRGVTQKAHESAAGNCVAVIEEGASRKHDRTRRLYQKTRENLNSSFCSKQSERLSTISALSGGSSSTDRSKQLIGRIKHRRQHAMKAKSSSKSLGKEKRQCAQVKEEDEEEETQSLPNPPNHSNPPPSQYPPQYPYGGYPPHMPHPGMQGMPPPPMGGMPGYYMQPPMQMQMQPPVQMMPPAMMMNQQQQQQQQFMMMNPHTEQQNLLNQQQQEIIRQQQLQLQQQQEEKLLKQQERQEQLQIQQQEFLEKQQEKQKEMFEQHEEHLRRLSNRPLSAPVPEPLAKVPLSSSTSSSLDTSDQHMGMGQGSNFLHQLQGEINERASMSNEIPAPPSINKIESRYSEDGRESTEKSRNTDEFTVGILGFGDKSVLQKTIGLLKKNSFSDQFNPNYTGEVGGGGTGAATIARGGMQTSFIEKTKDGLNSRRGSDRKMSQVLTKANRRLESRDSLELDFNDVYSVKKESFTPRSGLLDGDDAPSKSFKRGDSSGNRNFAFENPNFSH